MTMPSSGPLNMAGTTTPQSVANELGLGLTTAISMNTAAVRVLAGAGASGTAWSLSSMYGKINNWILYTVQGFSSFSIGTPVAVSASNNGLYRPGNGLVQKINNNGGGLIWDASAGYGVVSTVFDSAGKLWGSDTGGVIEFDPTSGQALQSFSITLTGGLGLGRWTYLATSNTASGVYLMGTKYVGGNSDTLLCKVSSSGVAQWGIQWDGDTLKADAVVVDSNNNAYVWAYADEPGYGIRPTLIKINTAGAVVWQYVLNLGAYNPASGGPPWALALDASDNVYIGASGSSALKAFVAKINPSGVIQWQKELSDPASPYMVFGLFGCMTADSAGNCYFAESVYVPANSDYGVGLFKFDSSGVLVWQRVLVQTSPAGVGLRPYSISTDNVGNLYISVNANNIIKVPVDGSKTGTFTVAGVTFTYSTNAITVANAAVTTTAGTAIFTSFTPIVAARSTATTITTGSTTVTTI